jgi:hypothetical protein
VSRPSRALAAKVVARASERCEYCLLSQSGQEAQFHIDHVIPVAANGVTTYENLAVACVSCSLRKGARRLVPDPISGEMVPVFNPRTEKWQDHFEMRESQILGRTSMGRATVAALAMNRPVAVAIRRGAMT